MSGDANAVRGTPAHFPEIWKLREHIFAEQDGIFPAALAGLSTAEWEAAGAVRSRAGLLLPTAGG
jgi:hypothetical protein